MATVRMTQQFVDDFNLVMAAFNTPPEEIEECKAFVRKDPLMAEAAYHSSAAMIRAGWKPLEEQRAAFIARTGFIDNENNAAA